MAAQRLQWNQGARFRNMHEMLVDDQWGSGRDKSRWTLWREARVSLVLRSNDRHINPVEWAGMDGSYAMMNLTTADVELHQTIQTRTHWGNWAPTSPTYAIRFFFDTGSDWLFLNRPARLLSVPDLNGRQRGYTRGER